MIDDLIRQHPEKYAEWVREFYREHKEPECSTARLLYNAQLEKYLTDKYYLSQNITTLLPPYTEDKK